MSAIRVRPAQLPRASWRCAFHLAPPFEESTFVYDVESGAFAGALCTCGAYKYPVGRFGSRRAWTMVVDAIASLILIGLALAALVFVYLSGVGR